MSAPPVLPEAPELPARKSLSARFLGVFISPGETFADIARRPDFLAPLILLMLTTIAVSETLLRRIGMERLVRMQIEHSSRASSMTPAQMQQAVEQGVRIATILAHVGFVFLPVVLLIIAAICLAVTNAIFGGKITFRTAFSVACYADLVSVLASLIAIVMIIFGDVEHFNPQNPVPTNPGFFLNPAETPRALLSLAGSFDIFSLWIIVLLGIGLSEAAGLKVKTTSVTLTLFGLWLAWVLAKVVMSTLAG